MENEEKEKLLPAGGEKLQGYLASNAETLDKIGGKNVSEFNNANKAEGLPEDSGVGKSSFEGGIATEGAENAADKYDLFAKQEEGVVSDRASLEEEMKEKENSLKTSQEKENIPSFSGKKIPIITVVAAFLILAALAAYYFIAGNKNGSVQTETADGNVIVKSSVEAMKGVKSYTYDGKAGLSYSMKNNSLYSSQTVGGNFQMKLKGVADISNKENPANYGYISYDTKVEFGSDASGSSFTVESVDMNDKRYIRIGDFKVEGIFADSRTTELQNNFKNVSGSWYFLSDQDYKDFVKEFGTYGATPTFNDVNNDTIGNFSELFADYNFLNFSKDLGTDKIGNIETYHYKIGVNTKQAFELAAAIMEKSAEQNGANDAEKKVIEELKNNSADFDKAKQIVDFVMKDVDIEAWIGKDDKLVRRLKIYGSFDQEFVKGFHAKMKEVYGSSYVMDSEGIPNVNIGFDIDLVLSDFNVSQVREPQDAKDFKEISDIFKKISVSSGGSSSSISGTADADDDGLGDEQENFYGSDPHKADTDGDGYKDGDEVKNGYDPIVAGSAKLDFARLYKIK